jgi:type VI secretion system protein VasG
MIDAISTNTLLPLSSEEILTRMMDGKAITKVEVGAADNEVACAFE